jgi:hypothetical protein
MRWGRLSLGFLLGVIAGLSLGRGCWRGEASLWAAGAVALSLGVMCTLWAVRRPHAVAPEPAESPGWDHDAAPPLGQMLLNYGLISEAGLEKALARQQRSGMRLGRILVEMGLVTHAQLAEVLEEQISRREGRLLWGAGQRLLG